MFDKRSVNQRQRVMDCKRTQAQFLCELIMLYLNDYWFSQFIYSEFHCVMHADLNFCFTDIVCHTAQKYGSTQGVVYGWHILFVESALNRAVLKIAHVLYRVTIQVVPNLLLT